MTVEEIFNKIATHMREGTAYHGCMIRAYEFLGLWGLSMCHTWHYFEEQKNCREWEHYYASHYFKLIQIGEFNSPKIIPDSWYKYSAQAVDIGFKRTSIKDLMTKWVEWEKDTKKLYEEMYLELTNLREIAAANKVKKLIDDVDEELRWAQIELLNFDSIGYDLTLIIDWQDKMKKQFEKELKHLF